MPQALLAIFVAIWLSVSSAAAQTGAPEPVPVENLGLAHSAMKAVTYKAGVTAANVVIYSAAAGTVVAGTAMTLIGAGLSFVVYTVNDYYWGTQAAAAPAAQDSGESLGFADELWQTTKKFVTYKASTIWIKPTLLYVYTGSVTITLAAASVSSLVNLGLFYTNNIAWDYYDASVASPSPVVAASAVGPS